MATSASERKPRMLSDSMAGRGGHLLLLRLLRQDSGYSSTVEHRAGRPLACNLPSTSYIILHRSAQRAAHASALTKPLMSENVGSGCPASCSRRRASAMPTPNRCTKPSVRIASARLGLR